MIDWLEKNLALALCLACAVAMLGVAWLIALAGRATKR